MPTAKALDKKELWREILHYAEENPAEVLEVIEDKTEALIRELEAQERAARRGGGRRVTRTSCDRREEVGADIPF